MLNCDDITTGAPKLTFDGVDDIDGFFYSQAAQDIFVLSVLSGRRAGFFLDIGCYEPKQINNTYLLESKFGWSGIMFDINSELTAMCDRERTATTVCGDATSLDYVDILKDAPKIIDYISLDIDGMNTLRTLFKLPLDTYRFRVMTFEHDAYCREEEVRTESRKYLESLGYVRVCSDVKNGDCAYEDWWVDPQLVDMTRANVFISDGLSWNKIVFNQ